MFGPNLLMWTAATIATAWKLSQFVRAPRDTGLRIVTVCTALVFLALSAQLATSLPAVAEFFPSQSPKLIQNVILTFFFALLIVLLHTIAAPELVGPRGWFEIALAVLASGGLLMTFAAAVPTARGASYEQADHTPAVLGFYLIGNLYMAYATARGTHLAWTMANHTQSHARLSLRVAAAGLAVNCLGTHMPRVLSTSGRLIVDQDLIRGTATWTTPILAIGIIAFFLGIGYPGARTGVIKARMWIEARYQYHQLRPLWIALCGQFPKIAMFSIETPRREALQIFQMRLRFYRRIVECRDGLVCLSPFVVEALDAPQTPEQQAEMIYDALMRAAIGEEVAVPSMIAGPEAPGIEADIQQLVAVSRAFKRIANTRTQPGTAKSKPAS